MATGIDFTVPPELPARMVIARERYKLALQGQSLKQATGDFT